MSDRAFLGTGRSRRVSFPYAHHQWLKMAKRPTMLPTRSPAAFLTFRTDLGVRSTHCDLARSEHQGVTAMKTMLGLVLMTTAAVAQFKAPQLEGEGNFIAMECVVAKVIPPDHDRDPAYKVNLTA